VPTQFLVIALFFRLCFDKLKIPMTPSQKGDDELEIVAKTSQRRGIAFILGPVSEGGMLWTVIEAV